MLRPRVSEIRHGTLVGRCFVGGYLLGKGMEMLSGRQTSYGSYLGLRMGVLGCCLHLLKASLGAARKMSQ